MRDAKAIGRLARVSKAFGHCVKMPRMLDRMGLIVQEKMLKNIYVEENEGDEGDDDEDYGGELDEEAMDEARALLEVYLREAGERYAGLGRLEISRGEGTISFVVQNDTVDVVASMFPALKALKVSYCEKVSDVSSLSSLTSLTELYLK